MSTMTPPLSLITVLTGLAITLGVVLPSSATQPNPSSHDRALHQQQPVVNIVSFGAVRGRVVRAGNGLYAQEFLNIPYAQPPVGKLRFRAPVEFARNDDNNLVWNDVRDGTQLGCGCVQNSGPLFDWMFKQSLFSFIPKRVSEDCLNINVHVPHEFAVEKSKKLVPVIVWMHGGVFRMGSNSVPLYNGSVLASELGVIVAVPQFRLGPLGSFSLDGDDDINGNQGLLDQSMALKWIHEHIADFGGDPDQITLMGLSSGAASVHYHLLSHMSRDYFRRAVLQSGTALSVWGHQAPERSRLEGRWFAEAAGCTANARQSTENVLDCLQNLTARDVILTTTKLYLNKQHEALFNPTTDGVFLTKPPSQYIREGDFKPAELMLGTAVFEIMPLLALMYPMSLVRALPNVLISEDEFADILDYFKPFISNAPLEAIEFVYRNWSVPERGESAERWRMMNAVADDIFMFNGVVDVLDAYAKHNLTLYRYMFEHKPSKNMYGLVLPASTHGDDASYFMGHALDPALGLAANEVALAKRILHGPLNNFVRTGNPNGNNNLDDEPHWPPYAGKMDYFVIDAKSEAHGAIKFGPERWRAEFWRHAVPYLSQLTAEGQKSLTSSDTCANEQAVCMSEREQSFSSTKLLSSRRKNAPKTFYANIVDVVLSAVKSKLFDLTLSALPYLPL